jgi:PTH1 family peptidyl-tRNA hydrolase
VKLVFGLGNPGTRYENTRHNLGFMVIEELARRHDIDIRLERFHAWFGTGTIGGHTVGLGKPTTFVNRSGQAVAAARAFYKVELHDLLVIVDDLALEPGRLRFRPGGRDGGHNGLANVDQHLGSNEYPRLRIGIGPGPQGSTPHVLGRISEEERPLFDSAVRRAADGVAYWLDHDVAQAMNRFNGTMHNKRSDTPEDET